MKLIADMIASALRTAWRVLLMIVFLVSLAFNVSTAAVGLGFSVVSSVVEAVTGLPQAGSVKSKEKAAQKAADELTTLKRKAGGLETDLSAAKRKAAKLEGNAADLGLRMRRAEGEVAKLTAALKVPRKVVFEGAEVATEVAIARVSYRVKARTAKVATADMGAIFGQSIPWIGVGVVVAATAYDLKTACDTMKDMHALDVALNPATASDPSVQEVCGLRVPSKEEIWAKVKASPREAWDWANAALPDLPEMPDMPEIDWTFWD